MAEKNVKFYKTKDGTVVYCKDEVARQQIEQLQGIWEAIEELPDGQAVSAQVAIHTIEIAALQNGKANINGSYEGMTVGMAKNIEAREIVSGIFTHRPTAGNAECATGAAKVRSIKGNSVAWEQILPDPTEKMVSSYFGSIHNGTFNCDVSHKYYIIIYAKTSDAEYPQARVLIGTPQSFNSPTFVMEGISATYQRFTKILAPYNTANGCQLKLTSAYGANLYCKDCQVIDLTTLRIDNLTTTDEVEAWLQANVGLQPYYAYNAGELLSAKMLGMKTVGFDQWDGALESGYWDTEDGSAVANPNWKRSSNPIKVLPDTNYFAYSPSFVGFGYLLFYDGQMNYLGYLTTGLSSQPTFKTPVNCCFVHFYANPSLFAIDTFCINISDASKNGTYEPYDEHTYDFDTSKVYGKLGGYGELVQIFTDGMKSAGSVRDELIINSGSAKAIKRVGSVDMGDLSWSAASYGLLTWHLKQLYGSKDGGGIITDKVAAGNISAPAENTIVIRNDGALVYTKQGAGIHDLDDANAFYELKDSVEYTDLVYRDNGVDVPLLDYFSGVILVDNYGTEEQLLEPPTDNNPNSCAAGMDIVYGVNAADFIDSANNGSFISKPSQDALLSTLSAALGGTLSATWNAATGHYDYTFTQNRQSNEEPHDD